MKFNKALATSFRILSKKAYSRQEIKNKLIKFEYNTDEIEAVLEKLEQMNLIDDVEYANIITQTYKNKGWGKAKIREELRKRGICDEILSNKLEEFNADYEIIVKHYHNKLKGEVCDYNSIQKAKAFLYRKGFSFDEINHGFLEYKEKLEDDECL